ncbi:calcium-binding protein [Paractinoplanes maris]|uniref:calcium-binding protein n=1 Tax=Paractinoplanes maris TaxID=1734446 RepID=UPI00201FD8A1|nr:calcium-binding protein [Actinoplanes maris]
MRKSVAVLSVAAVSLAGSLLAAGPAAAATRAACPVRATIYGTTGNDRIDGTAGPDIICAGAGDDHIEGLGGNDRVYGGPGNDTIITLAGRDTVNAGSGSDLVNAGAGDDLIFGDNPVTSLRDRTDTGADGNDRIQGGLGSESIEGGGGNDLILTGGVGGPNAALGTNIVHGGPGNDVILSDFRFPGGFEWFYGDAGSDVLWPNPVRLNPLGNLAVGGAGKDIILLANLQPDGAHLGDIATSVTVPVSGACGFTVPLPDDPKPGDTGKFSCKLPVGLRIPGLIDAVKVSVSVNAAGKFSSKVDVKYDAAVQAAFDWHDLVTKGALPVEACLCDPKLPGRLSVLGDTVKQ